MFKKILPHNFLEKVSHRVLTQLNEKISVLKKQAFKKAALYLSGVSIMLCGLLAIIMLAFHVKINNLNSSNFNILLSLGGIFFWWLSIAFIGMKWSIYRDKFFLFHRLKKQLSIQNIPYQEISKTDEIKDIVLLTSEEIHELLSLTLNPLQVDYLQQMIFNKKHFTLEHLAHLNSLLTDDERTHLHNQEKQCVFSEFIKQHQLEQHSSDYLSLERDKQKLDEHQLSARL